jgi:hypothetical protein
MEDEMILKTSHPWILAFIVFLVPMAAISEEDSKSEDNGKHDHEFDLEIFRGRPTISLYYGFSDNSLENLDQSLATTNLVELRLGGMSKESVSVDENILEYEYGYFSLAKISDDLGDRSDQDKLNTDLWRVNFGWEDGYGYNFKGGNLVTYSSFAFGWSKLKVQDNVLDPSDSDLLGLFDDEFRFGTKMEGGIKVQVIPYMTADAGYERSIIYPRFLFWKALVSLGLESVGQWLLDEFIDEILDSSPAAVPVVSFFLKNGLSYGVYELRKEDMNYPFDTASPFLTDTVKIGASFVF